MPFKKGCDKRLAISNWSRCIGNELQSDQSNHRAAIYDLSLNCIGFIPSKTSHRRIAGSQLPVAR